MNTRPLLKHIARAGSGVLLCAQLFSYSPSFAQQSSGTGQPENFNHTISYQGELRESGVVHTGDVAMTVSLATDPEGKSVVWSDTYLTSVRDGHFAIELGSGNVRLPEAETLDKELWVSIRIGESQAPIGFTRLSASPFALNVADRSITASKLNTDYVAAVNINGKKVTTQGGELSLTQGKGVKLAYDAASSSVVVSLDRTTAGGGKGDSTSWLGQTGTGNVDGGSIYNVVAGGADNTADDNIPIEFNTIGGGHENLAEGGFSSILGGRQNRALSQYSSIVNGEYNTAQGSHASIGGGMSNDTDGEFATISGGADNLASAPAATVSGGISNIASGLFSFVGGGGREYISGFYGNSAVGDYSAIVGGQRNTTDSRFSFVGGGFFNLAVGEGAAISGGSINYTEADYAAIGGGYTNAAYGYSATIAGGSDNISTGTYASIGGGVDNSVYGNKGTIGGGESNKIFSSIEVSGTWSTIGGGDRNSIWANWATIAGGRNNLIDEAANYAAIGGGAGNNTTMAMTTIPGGENLIAQSYGQIVMGFNNQPQGTTTYYTNAQTAPWMNDRILIIGNGTSTELRTNAFEVSNNGHSIVYDRNESGATRGAMRGATYTDNVIYAWASVPSASSVGAVVPNVDFGVQSVYRNSIGSYRVTLNIRDADDNPIVLEGGAPVVSIGESGCYVTSVTPIVGNSFTVEIYNPRECTLADAAFNFHVCARPPR